MLALFAAAVLWQQHWRTEARIARDAARSHAPPDELKARDLPEGWGRVIVGRPSGAAPVADERPRRREQAADPDAKPAEDVRALVPTPPTSGEQAREFQLVVQSGQSLSAICKAHYGSGRSELVQALATYNGLADANRLRAGQSLQLPPIEKLLPQDP